MKTLQRILLILAVAMLPLLVSCEFASSSSDEKEIDLVIMCSGGTTSNTFTFDIIKDSGFPFSDIPGNGITFLPLGDIENVTITVTRNDNTASLAIAIYENNELADNGYTALSSCTSTSTSCSNTLTLTYEVDDEDSATASSDEDEEDE